MLKKVMSLVLVVAMLFSFTGCQSEDQAVNEENEKGQVEEVKEVSTIVDSKGREIEIPENKDKLVALNGNVYDILSILGLEDNIIAVNDSMAESIPGAKDKVAVGDWKTPSAEKILELEPDVVFGYTKYTEEEFIKQLEKAGITVVLLDFYNCAELIKETEILGKFFDKEDEAKEFTGFISGNLQLIKDRTKDIKEEDKVNVYFEGYSDYATAGPGSGGHELVLAANCINIAGEEDTAYPKISDEWVLERNPEIVVKNVSNRKGLTGPGVTDESKVKPIYDSIVGRTGWENIEAVKNNKVIIMDSSISMAPQGSVIGALYIAKLAYPEEFKDIDPNAINKEMQEKFFNQSEDGIFVYPAVN